MIYFKIQLNIKADKNQFYYSMDNKTYTSSQERTFPVVVSPETKSFLTDLLKLQPDKASETRITIVVVFIVLRLNVFVTLINYFAFGPS